ncbi:MAG: hypothetical protein JWO15_3531 [Sphingomonadales bacterium]|nr:hypothetical protein [Sphingomonadales bacterium]
MIQAVPYEYTNQGIFDFVYKFIVAQGAPSYSEENEGACLYRSADENGKTLQCAAGCLVTDDEAALLENAECWRAQTTRPSRLAPFNELIQELQHCHDDALICLDGAMPSNEQFIVRFKNKMRYLAKEFDLTVPE